MYYRKEDSLLEPLSGRDKRSHTLRGAKFK